MTQLDSDNDGLNDELDQCDDTPDGDQIDQYGCTVIGPGDSDGDGITDDVDGCPSEAGLPEYNGCPYTGPYDSDGDGVSDDIDACPSEAGSPSYNGCPVPDSDNDGLPDDVDACPDLPGPYDGCPLTDLDGDGVTDDVDACPSEAGPPEYNGCPAPDEDGDGVTDPTDGCPGTPQGENVDSVGCSLTQLDSDNDGLNDELDQCDDTPDGDQIDQYGCTVTGPGDSDGDGVTDDIDACPNEPGLPEYDGCPAPDEDGDGVTDPTDGCPGTPQGENVDSVGCSLTQLDSDNDGINDELDQCDDTPDGDQIDQHGCTVTGPVDTPVTPAPIGFDDRCGITQDTMTVPITAGVSYHRRNKELSAGTRRVHGKVTVTARAEEGYAIEGTSSWTRKFTSVPCPKGELTVSSPAAGKVKVVNGENTVLHFRVGSHVRVVEPGETVVVTTRSGRVRWTARWNGLFSPRSGFVRVD